MKKFEEIKLILEKNKDHLMSLEGIHSTGIGYSTDEKQKNKLTIHVYAESEEAIKKLLAVDKMPREIESVPVSIIITPQASFDILYVEKMSEIELAKDDKEYRPLQGGIQIYLENEKNGWYGTLGTFVKSQDTSDENMYLLSNLHVLDALDRAVYQPKKDKNNNFVAVTTTARSFPNTDAALAKVNDDVQVNINTIEGIGVVDEIKTIGLDDLNKTVIKRGRTTLLTEGTIETIFAQVSVILTKGVVRVFNDCVIVKPKIGELFSDSGDSGSSVVLKEENKLVGLHFAGNSNSTKGRISIFCKIDNVFNNLNVKLPKTEDYKDH